METIFWDPNDQQIAQDIGKLLEAKQQLRPEPECYLYDQADGRLKKIKGINAEQNLVYFEDGTTCCP